ncbi:hypothetical protein FQZ97_924580 [compost metagenome]
MDVLTDSEISGVVAASSIVRKYNEAVDRESAYEILNEKLASAQEEAPAPAKRGRPREEKSTLDTILSSSAGRQMARTAANLLTRTLLGAIGVSGTTTKKKKTTSWF